MHFPLSKAITAGFIEAGMPAEAVKDAVDNAERAAILLARHDIADAQFFEHSDGKWTHALYSGDGDTLIEIGPSWWGDDMPVKTGRSARFSEVAKSADIGKAVYEQFMRCEYHADWRQLPNGTRDRWNEAAAAIATTPMLATLTLMTDLQPLRDALEAHVKRVGDALELAKGVLRKVSGGRTISEHDAINALNAVSQAVESLQLEPADFSFAADPAPENLLTADQVEIARLTYIAKVKEYDLDFQRDDKPEGFWQTKYGTNLHSTSLGERWAMQAALEAIALPAPQTPLSVTDAMVDAWRIAFHDSYAGGKSDFSYDHCIRKGLEAAIAAATPETRGWG